MSERVFFESKREFRRSPRLQHRWPPLSASAHDASTRTHRKVDVQRMLRRVAARCCTRALGRSPPSLQARALPFLVRDAISLGGMLGRRSLSSTPDPYATLGVTRDASDLDIKSAFRKKALATHPDKNPDLAREQAEEEFAKVGNAYEVLKDPKKRQQYDQFGSVGGEGSATQAQHAEHARQVQEWIRAMQQRAREQQQPPPKPFPHPDMEAYILADVASLHSASRRSGISTDLDERRAVHAGKLGVIAKVDASDETCKVRVMVSPGRAEELWFGRGALWDPRVLEEGLEVQICADVEATHRASRAAGIDAENDGRRARCAGRIGTVVKVEDADQTVKVRVLVTATRADEVWFASTAVEPRRASAA